MAAQAPREGPAPARRRPLLALLTLIASTALAVMIGELGLRLIGFEFTLYPTQVQFGAPDPITLKERYVVDRDLLWVTPGYDDKLASWRGRSPTVAFMGDSCTQFGQYDRLLEALVRQHNPGSSFTSINLGVVGWTSYQGLQQLRRDVIGLKPRFVTLYYGWNDHWTSFGIEDKDIGRFRLTQPDLLLRLAELRIVQLFNRAVFTLRQSAPETGNRRPERVALADFRHNLTQMVRLAREHDIVPLLVTAPSSHRRGDEPAYLAERWLNDLDELVPLHERYVATVREVAAAEGVALVDLYAELRALPPAELRALFLEDGIHLTEAGSLRVAESLLSQLIAAGLQD